MFREDRQSRWRDQPQAPLGGAWGQHGQRRARTHARGRGDCRSAFSQPDVDGGHHPHRGLREGRALHQRGAPARDDAQEYWQRGRLRRVHWARVAHRHERVGSAIQALHVRRLHQLADPVHLRSADMPDPRLRGRLAGVPPGESGERLVPGLRERLGRRLSLLFQEVHHVLHPLQLHGADLLGRDDGNRQGAAKFGHDRSRPSDVRRRDRRARARALGAARLPLSTCTRRARQWRCDGIPMGLPVQKGGAPAT
mmetsp:Transcript_8952/g.36530  ORF Transcript_8952/g.36530 Transcript_8952/m.36530 type:complete len:253 (+) Transcript_8952:1370-2128(+)